MSKYTVVLTADPGLQVDDICFVVGPFKTREQCVEWVRKNEEAIDELGMCASYEHHHSPHSAVVLMRDEVARMREDTI